jgi:protein involved in sex pheromone biosynthesis
MKKTFYLLLASAAMFLAGCSEKHHEGDGHDHSAEKHSTEDGHKHE